MPDIASLLAAASPPELTVPVSLDGAATARVAVLQAELAALDQWQPSSLGDTSPAAALSEQLAQAHAEAAAAVVEFRFRSLGYRAFSALLACHPPAAGSHELYDAATFLPALLTACCVHPTLSPGQVDQLLERVNHGTAQALFDAALAVNSEPNPVPFS